MISMSDYCLIQSDTGTDGLQRVLRQCVPLFSSFSATIHFTLPLQLLLPNHHLHYSGFHFRLGLEQ